MVEYSIIPSIIILPLASVMNNLLISSKPPNSYSLSKKRTWVYWALERQIPSFDDMDTREEDNLDSKVILVLSDSNLTVRSGKPKQSLFYPL